jgi:hypothetical protein
MCTRKGTAGSNPALSAAFLMIAGSAPREADPDADPDRLLAVALERASAAGRWDVVAQLARELEARRLAGSNVALIRRRQI